MFGNKDKEKRFEVVYSYGTMETYRILRDVQTGVHYLYVTSGYSGGLTVLLDENGKPVIDKSEDK